MVKEEARKVLVNSPPTRCSDGERESERERRCERMKME